MSASEGNSIKKVYLDLSSYNNILRENNNCEETPKFKEIILKSKEKGLRYYYSPSHILDLEDADAKEDKLKLIEEISENNLIYYYNGLKHMNRIPTYYSKYQTKLINSYSKELPNFDAEKFKNKFGLNNIDSDFIQEQKEIVSNIYNSEDYYKKYRKKLKSGKRIKKENFINIVKQILSCKNIDLFYLIRVMYKVLDMIIDDDTLKDKDRAKYKNIDIDSQHCYFASYCNYFVTEDKKLHSKSEFIYNILKEEDIKQFIIKEKYIKQFINLNINTEVYNLSDFIAHINKL